MTSEKNPASKPQQPDHELDRRYGAIGISAVAAAVQYAHGPQPAGDKQEPQERRGRPDRAA